MSSRAAHRLSFVLLLAAAVVALAASGGRSLPADADDNAAPGRPSEAGPSLFDDRTVLELALAAPFDDLFARADTAPDTRVPGKLSYVDPATGRRVELPGVEVEVRGNSSRRQTECSFPKLKLRFPDDLPGEARAFAGIGQLKIGTHCDDLPDGQLTFQFGRWGNEKAPFREALVYRLFEAVDVATPRSRPARITYEFTPAALSSASATAGRARTPRTLVRNALLVEDEADAMARLGAAGQLLPPGEKGDGQGPGVAGRFETADRHFTAEESARVAFAEAMVGNFDWAIKFNAADNYRDARRGLWNALAFARRDGTAFPVVYDFDLAGIVVGRHPWYSGVFPRRFGNATAEAAIEVLSQVQRTRSLFERHTLDATRAFFLARRADIEAAAKGVPVDPQGRGFAATYLQAFFDAIASDEAFYLPVIARAGLAPMSAGRPGAPPACRAGDGFPVGTPVNQVGAASAGLAEVQVLDVFWKWEQRGCPGIRQGTVWVDPTGVDRDYPKAAAGKPGG